MIITIKTGYLEENCYILTNNNDCLIIDPGDNKDKILENIKDYNVLGILVTHNHFDHIGAIKDIINKYKVPVFDKNNLKEGIHNISIFCFEVIYNKGHSDDSISFYFKDINSIFVGDFIFKGTIGRCDLDTGDEQEMYKSLEEFKNKFKDNNVDIYPGHGEKTCYYDELQNNPFLT